MLLCNAVCVSVTSRECVCVHCVKSLCESQRCVCVRVLSEQLGVTLSVCVTLGESVTLCVCV